MISVSSDHQSLDSGTLCELSTNLSDWKTLSWFSVGTKNSYSLALLNCVDQLPTTLKKSDLEVIVDISYRLQNGNQELSLGYEPLPITYSLLCAMWSILCLIWAVSWIYYKSNRVSLHWLVILVCLLKLSMIAVALSYWRVCQATGKCIQQVKYVQSFLFAISETAFFCALLLVAKGWKITRVKLPAGEVRTISIALVLLLSTLLFFSFYNEGYYFLRYLT